MKVVFFGTPSFAAETLLFLLNHDVNVVAVITRPDRPKGRSGTPLPPPVKETVSSWKHSIPIYQPEKVSAPEFADLLKSFDADLFVVVAYGEILKQHVLDTPKKGCINLHASLLPKYRGAAPIQRSLINGETKTGITIMHMVKKMDAGEMIQSISVPIEPDDTYPVLENKLQVVGAPALLEVIHAFARGTVISTPQDESLATFAPKVELEECQIDWNLPAQNIHNLIRGVTPEPGAWCYVTVKGEKKRLKILQSKIVSQTGNPGEILSFDKNGFIVAAKENAIGLKRVQLEGKKVLTECEFIRGLSKDLINFN